MELAESPVAVDFIRVGGGEASFGRLTVTRAATWDGAERPIRSNYYSARERVDQILHDARGGEDYRTAAQAVWVSVEDQNQAGDSFGFALAVADKRARFQAVAPDERIVATGRIEPGGHGKVAAVDGFVEKVRHVIDHVRVVRQAPMMLLLPNVNLAAAPPELQAELDALQATGTGFRYFGITHLSELDGKLWQGHPPPPLDSWWRHGLITTASAMLFVIVAGAAYTTWKALDTPLARCAREVDQWDATRPTQSVDKEFAASMEICSVALKEARKDSDENHGKAAYLLGRLMQLNGSPSQNYSPYWEEAVENRNADAEFDVGRLQIDKGDYQRAHLNFERAAAGGRAEARDYAKKLGACVNEPHGCEELFHRDAPVVDGAATQ